MTWTLFFDTKSGGKLKTAYQAVVIELPRAKAMMCFENSLHVDPTKTTCPCCSPDFHISTHSDVEQATGALRNAAWKKGVYTETPVKYRTLTSVEYLKSAEIALVISLADIDLKRLVSYVMQDEYGD